MRIHIEIADELIARMDQVAGRRGRSRFVRDAVEAALDRVARAQKIRSTAGAISDEGHVWDRDPAVWVRAQRRGDRRRIG